MDAAADVPVPSLWVVRGGRDGVFEDVLLTHGYCGIGWPDLGDLSVLDEDGLGAKLKSVYPERSVHEIGAARSSIENFLKIRPGDSVLMPLKTKAGEIAVGRVIGDYEHRPDLPGAASNVRKTRWERADVPREWFGDLKKWVDRAPTVSKVPAAPSLIDEMLRTGEKIELPKTKPAGRWSEILAEVLEELQAEEPARQNVRELLHDRAPGALSQLIGKDWPISDGTGSARLLRFHGSPSIGRAVQPQLRPAFTWCTCSRRRERPSTCP